jgi:hypothetical protein
MSEENDKPLAVSTPSSLAQPFTAEELRAALRHPGRAIDVLLAQRARWTLTVLENRKMGPMVALMLLWTLVFSLPYGCVLSAERTWQVATLFLGSVALCLPSLHVVSAFLGMRIHVAQSFAFATIVATVAAIFSFSFAPILWFMQATSHSSSPHDALGKLSALLLCVAALAGLIHGMRCLKLAGADLESRFGIVMFVWQLLLLFIGVRMSQALGLSWQLDPCGAPHLPVRLHAGKREQVRGQVLELERSFIDPCEEVARALRIAFERVDQHFTARADRGDRILQLMRQICDEVLQHVTLLELRAHDLERQGELAHLTSARHRQGRLAFTRRDQAARFVSDARAGLRPDAR